MTTSEKLLREWIAWFDSGNPKYMAPSGMTLRHLAQLQARENPDQDWPAYTEAE